MTGSSGGVSGGDAGGVTEVDGAGDASTNGNAVDASTSDAQSGESDAAKVSGDSATTSDSATTGDSAISTVCTSMMTWTSGNTVTMRPGESCLSCHTTFTIAGTVYPTAHEPDDCYGSRSTGNLTVVITDANGTTTSIPVNGVGNFFATAAVAAPYQAKVVDSTAGTERDMTVSQTVGDCNSCHTALGANNAPGRIVVP